MRTRIRSRLSCPRRSGLAAFTLIELLVVISIIGLLISILLPALDSALQSARSAACKQQISQIPKAIRAFATDNDQEFPTAISTRNGERNMALWAAQRWGIEREDLWLFQLGYNEYHANTVDGWQCPADTYLDRGEWSFDRDEDNDLVARSSYGANYAMRHVSQGIFSFNMGLNFSEMIMAADIGPAVPPEPKTWNGGSPGGDRRGWRDGGSMLWNSGNATPSSSPWITTRHGKGINLAGMDGHVAFAQTEQKVQDGPTRNIGSEDDIIRAINRGTSSPSTAGTAFFDFSDSGFMWWSTPALEPQSTGGPGR